jgi:hypothetical protein
VGGDIAGAGADVMGAFGLDGLVAVLALAMSYARIPGKVVSGLMAMQIDETKVDKFKACVISAIQGNIDGAMSTLMDLGGTGIKGPIIEFLLGKVGLPAGLCENLAQRAASVDPKEILDGVKSIDITQGPIPAMEKFCGSIGIDDVAEAIMGPLLEGILLGMGGPALLASRASEALNREKLAELSGEMMSIISNPEDIVGVFKGVFEKLGLGDVVEHFVKPAIVATLEGLGMHVAMVKKVLANLTEDKLKQLGPTLATMLKGGAMGALEKFCQVMGIESPVTVVFGPMLQKCLLGMGVMPQICEQAGKALTAPAFEKLKDHLGAFIFGNPLKALEPVFEHLNLGSPLDAFWLPSFEHCMRHMGASASFAAKSCKKLNADKVVKLAPALMSLITGAGDMGTVTETFVELGISAKDVLDDFILPVVENNLMLLGAPALLASKVSQAMNSDHLSALHVGLGELMFRKSADMLGTLDGIFKVLQLDNVIDSFLIPVFKINLLNCGAHPFLAQKCADALDTTSVAVLLPTLKKLVFGPMNVEILSKALDGVGLVDGEKNDIFKSFANKALRDLGAPEMSIVKIEAQVCLAALPIIAPAMMMLLVASSGGKLGAALDLVKWVNGDERECVAEVLRRRLMIMGASPSCADAAAQALGKDNMQECREYVDELLDSDGGIIMPCTKLFEILKLPGDSLVQHLVKPAVSARALGVGIHCQTVAHMSAFLTDTIVKDKSNHRALDLVLNGKATMTEWEEFHKMTYPDQKTDGFLNEIVRPVLVQKFLTMGCSGQEVSDTGRALTLQKYLDLQIVLKSILFSGEGVGFIDTLDEICHTLELGHLVELARPMAESKLISLGAPSQIADRFADSISNKTLRQLGMLFERFVFRKASSDTWSIIKEMFTLIGLKEELAPLMKSCLRGLLLKVGVPVPHIDRVAQGIKPAKMKFIQPLIEPLLFNDDKSQGVNLLEQLMDAVGMDDGVETLIVPALCKRIVQLTGDSKLAAQLQATGTVEQVHHAGYGLGRALFQLPGKHTLSNVGEITDDWQEVFEAFELGDVVERFAVPALQKRLYDLGAPLQMAQDIAAKLIDAEAQMQAPGGVKSEGLIRRLGPALEEILFGLGLSGGVCGSLAFLEISFKVDKLVANFVPPCVKKSMMKLGASKEFATQIAGKLNEAKVNQLLPLVGPLIFSQRPPGPFLSYGRLFKELGIETHTDENAKAGGVDKAAGKAEKVAKHFTEMNLALEVLENLARPGFIKVMNKLGNPRQPSLVSEEIARAISLDDFRNLHILIEGLMFGCDDSIIGRLEDIFSYVKVANFQDEFMKSTMIDRLKELGVKEKTLGHVDLVFSLHHTKELGVVADHAISRQERYGNINAFEEIYTFLELGSFLSRFIHPVFQRKLESLGVGTEDAEEAAITIDGTKAFKWRACLEDLLFRESDGVQSICVIFDAMNLRTGKASLSDLVTRAAGVQSGNNSAVMAGQNSLQVAPVASPGLVTGKTYAGDIDDEAAAAEGEAAAGGAKKGKRKKYVEVDEGEQDDEEFKIFGLFRNSKWRTVLDDSFPIVLITIYNVWQPISQRFLAALSCDAVPLVSKTEMRWNGNTSELCMPAGNLRAGFAIAGLMLWSFGFPAITYMCINQHEGNLEQPLIQHRFGYFYQGFEPDYWWWELLVKRLDSLTVLVITFTNVVPDAKAKLLLYLVLSGFWWACHNESHPYDDRNNGLLDRIESMAMKARFGCFFTITVLLLFNASPLFAMVIAAGVALLLLRFAFYIMVAIGAEVAGGQMKGKAPKAESGGGGGSNLDPRELAKKIGKKVMSKVGGIFIKIALKGLAIIEAERKYMATEVPHWQWLGPGKPLQLVDFSGTLGVGGAPRAGPTGWPRRALRSFVGGFYHLNWHEQCAFNAASIAKISDHMVTNLDFLQMPSQLMDIIALMTLALKYLQSEKDNKWKKKLNAKKQKEAKMNAMAEFEAMLEIIAAGYLADELIAAKENCGVPRRPKLIPNKKVTYNEVAFNPAKLQFCFNGEELNVCVMKFYSFDGERARRTVAFVHDLVVLIKSELENAALPVVEDGVVQARTGGAAVAATQQKKEKEAMANAVTETLAPVVLVNGAELVNDAPPDVPSEEPGPGAMSAVANGALQPRKLDTAMMETKNVTLMPGPSPRDWLGMESVGDEDAPSWPCGTAVEAPPPPPTGSRPYQSL